MGFEWEVLYEVECYESVFIGVRGRCFWWRTRGGHLGYLGFWGDVLNFLGDFGF